MRRGSDAIALQEGGPGDALFVVATGQVRVPVHTTSGDVRLNTLGPGDTLGEMAVVDGRGRTATAATSKTTEPVKIGRLAFLEDFPRPTAMLARILASRVRGTVQAIPDVSGLTGGTPNNGRAPASSGTHLLPRGAASPVGHRDDRMEMLEVGFPAALSAHS